MKVYNIKWPQRSILRHLDCLDLFKLTRDCDADCMACELPLSQPSRGRMSFVLKPCGSGEWEGDVGLVLGLGF
jgi:hypothetical protein